MNNSLHVARILSLHVGNIAYYSTIKYKIGPTSSRPPNFLLVLISLEAVVTAVIIWEERENIEPPKKNTDYITTWVESNLEGGREAMDRELFPPSPGREKTHCTKQLQHASVATIKWSMKPSKETGLLR